MGSLPIYCEGFPFMGSLAMYGNPPSRLRHAWAQMPLRVATPTLCGLAASGRPWPLQSPRMVFVLESGSLAWARCTHFSRQVIYHCCVVFLYLICACTFRFSRRLLTVPDGSKWCNTAPTAPDVSRRRQLSVALPAVRTTVKSISTLTSRISNLLMDHYHEFSSNPEHTIIAYST
jgi:hypothetical protein